MKRWASVIGVMVMCLIAGVVGAATTRQFGTSAYTMSYADFISVMLTAISLLMALLAFFIAILAFIGWNSISGKVASEVSRFLADGFKDGETLHRMVVDQANRAMYEGVYTVDTDLNEEDTEVNEASRPEGKQ